MAGTLVRVCRARLNKENGIPFNVKPEEKENVGIKALKRASQIAEEAGISDMSLDEINEEIAAARGHEE